MGCCLIMVVGLALPRVLLFFIWLLTDWFGRGFETAVWPVLGFLLMPYTTLAYMGAMLNRGSVSGVWVVLVIVAVLADLGSSGSPAAGRSMDYA